MREIVAAKHGTFVTNNPASILQMLAEDAKGVELFDRVMAKRMAYIIGGEHWPKIAEGPTLFLMDEDGEPHEVGYDVMRSGRA